MTKNWVKEEGRVEKEAEVSNCGKRDTSWAPDCGLRQKVPGGPRLWFVAWKLYAHISHKFCMAPYTYIHTYHFI